MKGSSSSASSSGTESSSDSDDSEEERTQKLVALQQEVLNILFIQYDKQLETND